MSDFIRIQYCFLWVGLSDVIENTADDTAMAVLLAVFFGVNAMKIWLWIWL